MRTVNKNTTGPYTNNIKEIAAAELEYVRKLGATDNLILASTNLGAYEAILYILSSADEGVPVYEAINSVRSRFSSQSGIIGRIKAMRSAGLIEERQGRKKSQVYLAPSEELIRELGPVLFSKYGDLP